MRIEPRGTEPGKPHIQHVALVRDDGTRVEIPVRKATLSSLSTAAKKLAYVQECAEYHAGTGEGWMERKNARRVQWDADDKTRTDAEAAAAKAAEEAKFIVTAHGITDGMVGVTIVHHGLTYSGNVAKGVDKAEFEQNCRAAFAAYETQVNAEKAELAALAINA